MQPPADREVYSVINIPSVLSNPSLASLVWSNDGQLCFYSKTTIYIMTPDHGINIDTTSVVKTTPDGDKTAKNISWFRTLFQIEKSSDFNWSESSQEWGAVSSGSLDVSISSVVFSPSGISTDAGCTLAVLTNNMDLSIWKPTENYLKGEWTKITDLTPFLLDLAHQNADDTPLSQTLKAQVTSIAWSEQVQPGVQPAINLDGSILAVGTRGGVVTLLSYNGHNMFSHLKTLPVDGAWVTQLAFSSWECSEAGKTMGRLAFSTSDGAIGVVRCSRHLDSATFSSFNDHFELVSEPIFRGDKRSITALRWLQLTTGEAVLVFCKPGVIHLWSPPRPGWSGHLNFRLRTQKVSADSSALHPPSGLVYVKEHDNLIVTLFDGSVHFLNNISSEPSWSSDGGNLTTERVSQTVRTTFQRIEGTADARVAMRVSGFQSYDDSGAFIWVHEASRPSDFSYKHDAKHSSMLVAANLWSEDADDHLLVKLSHILTSADAGGGLSPLYLLRPILLHLRDPAVLLRLHARILELVRPHPNDHVVGFDMEPWAESSPASGLKTELKKSLKRQLFGWNTTLALWMKISIADFIWKYSDEEERRAECGLVAQDLVSVISWRVLGTILKHIAAVLDKLNESDIHFVFRMIVKSQFPGTPPDLVAQGENLANAARAKLAGPHLTALGDTPGIEEHCPACSASVLFLDIASAICAKGHTWNRCSITTFILSNASVRTCVGCGRKAFTPASKRDGDEGEIGEWLPPAARTWLVKDLLEVVQRCLFCGNRFVSAL